MSVYLAFTIIIALLFVFVINTILYVYSIKKIRCFDLNFKEQTKKKVSMLDKFRKNDKKKILNKNMTLKNNKNIDGIDKTVLNSSGHKNDEGKLNSNNLRNINGMIIT
jgi:hypothetical protein